jgi:adenylate kinase
MKVLMVGIRASGKGTQAKKLSKKLDLPHISSGELFRDIDKNTILGRKIRSFIDKGNYVPDDLTIKLVTKRLNRKDCKKGYILDGFPRTLYEAQEFDKKHKFDYIFLIDIDKEEAILRTSGRRICPKCEVSYNVYTAPMPKKEGYCDTCNAKLVQRKDETREAAERRINIDMKEMGPMLKFYKKQGIVVHINGMQSIEKVHNDILKKLNLL